MMGFLNGPISKELKQKFLAPVDEALLSINSILDDLEHDSFAPKEMHREARATGSAFVLAASLLRYLCPGEPGRIMAFLGGPCTIGPGAVLSTDLAEKMRQHENFEKDSGLKYYNKAKLFYEKLARNISEKGHVLDLFIGSRD